MANLFLSIWTSLIGVFGPRGKSLSKAQKILIVDDDPSILETLGLKLTAAGYKVLKAANGLEAVKIAR